MVQAVAAGRERNFVKCWRARAPLPPSHKHKGMTLQRTVVFVLNPPVDCSESALSRSWQDSTAGRHALSREEPARGLQQAKALDTHNPPYCKAPCGPASQDSISARAHRENLCLKTRDGFGVVVVHAMVPIVRVDPLQHLVDGRTASCSHATHAVRLSYQIRVVARGHAPVFCLLPSN